MSAPTAPAQLTEEMILEALDRYRAEHPQDAGHLRDVVSDTIAGVGSLFHDLRPSEEAGQDDLADAAISPAAAKCEAIIRAAAVELALTFAAEFPDAPRTMVPAAVT
jgi:hypothetical protein